jgi:hypothetical protein
MKYFALILMLVILAGCSSPYKFMHKEPVPVEPVPQDELIPIIEASKNLGWLHSLFAVGVVAGLITTFLGLRAVGLSVALGCGIGIMMNVFYTAVVTKYMAYIGLIGAIFLVISLAGVGYGVFRLWRRNFDMFVTVEAKKMFANGNMNKFLENVQSNYTKKTVKKLKSN